MKKISIRMRFSILIGLSIFFFSIIMMVVSTTLMQNEMSEARDAIQKNIIYVESNSETEIVLDNIYEVPNVHNDINKPNNKPETKIDRSSESYKVASNIMDEAFKNTLDKQILSSLILGIIGFFIAYPISGLLLRPFNRLVSDINHIDDNLAYSLHIDNPKDEIGKIKSAFNKLIARIKEVLDRQSNFSSNVAHELKTPLAVMKMYPETLDEDSTIEDYREVINILKKNTNRMSELVDDLLSYSKMDEQTKALVNLKDIVDLNIEYLRPLINEKNINIQNDLKDFSFITSQELISRLVYNLLSNAIRYNKDGGSIYISLNGREFTIRDTGIGIPKESIDKIFEPLYCVDKSRSRELGGSGLGLSIVKKICDILGYKIEVSSKENYGTEFTIKL